MKNVLSLLFVFGIAAAAPGQPAAEDSGWIRDWLVLPSTGSGGRVPIRVDGVSHALAYDAWKRPVAGETVRSADDEVRAWEAARAEADGWLSDRRLRGGHAAATVTVETGGAMLLEAAGHSLVHCNGAPRAGDPYGFGYVRLPVWLAAGENELLFQVGRGRLRARLTPLRAAAQFNPDDLTLPDLVVGEAGERLGAVIVINAGREPLADAWIEARVGDGAWVRTQAPRVAGLTIRKTPFSIATGDGLARGEVTLQLRLLRGGAEEFETLDTLETELQVRTRDDVIRRTFVSEIDGSVQYYAVRYASAPGDGKALFLSLHGASVEASSQAAAYAAKEWGHLVAPTNRRPYGFDWEDWGRWDALEVLERAARELRPDPGRVYLTGHSMGGHGTWHVGVTFPDRFAAIAPSAGWASFRSYGGAVDLADEDPVAALFQRARSASDTVALIRNLEGLGVYVLHGDADDNVPVREARAMRAELADFHPDFAYHEQPGAGHWWGNACVDWPELFDFLRRRQRPAAGEVHAVRFRTASPGVSATADWATIEMQQRALALSAIDLAYDAAGPRVSGTTENVRRLTLRLDALRPESGPDALAIELDGDVLEGLAWPADDVLRLRRDEGRWAAGDAAPPEWKGPQRYGPFKNVFRNNVVLVYGTAGEPAESAWAYARARYDAEVFWYRGNGALELMADSAYDAAAQGGRNVVLYGNADTNTAWERLLGASPLQVGRGAVRWGEATWRGDDLAAVLIRPMPGDERALVGAVAGSGLAGMRATLALPYFVSGVAYPDVTVLRADALRTGLAGVVLTGFYGERWDEASGDFAGE